MRKTWLYKVYRYTWFGSIIQSLIFLFKYRILGDKFNARRKFFKAHGRYPNLRDPKTLNEKIVWLKLHDRTPLHTLCADKFAVRDFIAKIIGSEYLVPLLFVTKDANDLKPESLPEEPFVLKTNHDSGGVVIVKDKYSVDWKKIRKEFRKKLKNNYYYGSGEWQYKNIKPRIIIESLLQNSDGKIPFDYKVHCFNGRVNMIQVDIDRDHDHHRNWYNRNWEREPYMWTSVGKNGKKTVPLPYDIEPPKKLDLMCELSEKIAHKFDYVRIDWYTVDEELYFGEITFHHDSGNRPIEPEEWDLKLGQRLIITKLNK